MAELALRGVTKRFDDVEAVRGMNLELASGEFVVLLGPRAAPARRPRCGSWPASSAPTPAACTSAGAT